MSSIKLKFRPSTTLGNQGVLYFQIIHNREVRRTNTNHHILPQEWNEISETIIVPNETDPDYQRLKFIASDIKWEIRRFEEIIKHFDNENFNLDEIVDIFVGKPDNKGFLSFMLRQVQRLQILNRIRSSEAMYYTLLSFMQFRKGFDLGLKCFTKDVAEQYQAWLKAKGVKRNTSSFYLRNLRTVYKTAVEQELIIDNEPFRDVYTGIDKTVKRAISLEQIRKIRELKFRKESSLELARNLLMFSFYMRGMSFVDMAYLQKSDMKGGRIVYRRKKTGQELTIEVPPEAKKIIAKYASKTCYLLPIIKRNDGTERSQYKNRIIFVNRKLKRIGEMIGLKTPLSTYVMRHSWATIARDKGIELSVISQALGHDNEATTQIYLDSINSSKVDKANRAILDEL